MLNRAAENAGKYEVAGVNSSKSKILLLYNNNAGFGPDVRCRSFKIAESQSKSRQVRVTRFILGFMSFGPDVHVLVLCLLSHFVL